MAVCLFVYPNYMDGLKIKALDYSNDSSKVLKEKQCWLVGIESALREFSSDYSFERIYVKVNNDYDKKTKEKVEEIFGKEKVRVV